MYRSTALVAGISSAAWLLTHFFVGDKLFLRLMPQAARSRAEEKKKTDDNFRRLLAINATAFTHACVVTALGLSVALKSEVRGDPFNGESTRFDVANAIMVGYFTWDVLICLKEYRVFGLTFFAHAVISLVACVANAMASQTKMVLLVSMFVGTEISTPALHMRWLLLQVDMASSRWFKLANFIFIALFIGYRLVLVPVYAVAPFFRDCLAPYAVRETAGMGIERRVCYVTMIMFWLALNYYWAFLMLKSQSKTRVKRE